MSGALQAAYNLLSTTALMGILSVAFGLCQRSRWPFHLRSALLGLLMGLAAVLAMFEPVRIAQGVIVDLRSLPVVIASAFLSTPAAAVTLGVAAVGRLALGGLGAPAGLVGLLFAAIGGVAWREWEESGLGDPAHRLPLLALVSCAGFLGGVALPPGMVWPYLADVAAVAPVQFVSVLFVGYLFDRERRQKEAEDRLSRAADYDLLTGVLNRRGFESAAAAATPRSDGAALLLLDIDHFKSVNDRLGHPAGDAILRQLRARLEPHLRPDDLLGRIGGEEFAVYLPQIAPESAERVSERLRKAVRSAPFDVPSGPPLDVTVSIGLAWAEGRCASAEALMSTADVALYAAKQQGRDRCVMVDPRDLDHDLPMSRRVA